MVASALGELNISGAYCLFVVGPYVLIERMIQDLGERVEQKELIFLVIHFLLASALCLIVY